MSKKAFSTKFILVNDIQQGLDPRIFGGGPWVHLATIVRGFKEYMCFKHSKTDKVYIEEILPSEKGLLKQIEDTNEFTDLQAFLNIHGILDLGINKEFKIAKPKN
jgi:hypothetical protein